MKLLKSNWPIIFILIFTIIFFHRLFFPTSIFSTPGDISYFNYPLKNFLSESLKNHQLPFWTNLIGTGFPLLADSPIGAFYLPNLILFYFFPMPIAFNLHYILIFLTSTIGTYLLCRYYKLSKPASLYAALAFGYSGFFVARIIHTSFIQLASLLPFLFLIIEKYIEKNEKKYLFIFAIFICQLIFIGYLQALVYSLFTIYIYLLLKSYLHKFPRQKVFNLIILISSSIVAGIILASAQVLPTLEMLKFSTRSSGLGAEELFRNSGSLKILALFLNPFIYGNISKGTLNSAGLGFYWENIAYSGILTPALAFLALLFVKKNKKVIFIFGFIAFLSLFLAVGRFGPAHVIFDIPPFSYFRIPSRFLFISSFSLAVLSAFTINKFQKNKIITGFSLGLIIFLVFDIFRNWYTFNPYTHKKLYLQPPQSLTFINSTLSDNTRITSLWPWLQKSEPVKNWNEEKDKSLVDFNSLNPNINMVFGVPSSDFYTSFSTRRLDLIRKLYSSSIKIENENEATITNQGLNLLKIQSVKYLLTEYSINNDSLQKVDTIQKAENSNPLYIYKVTNTFSRFRILRNYEVVKNVNDLVNKVQDKDFNFNSTVILEKEPLNIEKQLENAKINNVSETGNNITLNITSTGQGFLNISDTFYPGWEAKVNNKKTEIFAANVNSKAILLNDGENNVEVSYKPNSLKTGILISLLSHLIILTLIFTPQKFFKGLSSIWRRKISAESK
ncbi:hypothetical protein A2159_01605 [Candidatus Woesebacteria bacterium RBG_13_34_9]|uniref:Membrane protein 6-pyruvoyl-tetrahydropterin synthase-related domain-containing protein n=1 Tax=Candidatus Woesebacteria bacterium RBG_13_34_9 TaxID=1802477 RepID=A0A1F7X0K5_9BACT|nr:MAG: hypothetical protein A2159_01605 [Candidatus Woesebacteria bacterium RBG_13_34_9]